MGDNILGGVTVEVRARLDQLGPGLAVAKSQVDAFDKAAVASMQNVQRGATNAATAISQSATTAATAQDQLTAALKGQGAISAAAVRQLGGLEAVQKQAGQAAAQSAVQQTAAATKTAAASSAAAKSTQDYQKRADALRSVINPLFTAQQKYAGQLKESRELLQAGAITFREHTMYVSAATAAYDHHEHAVLKAAKAGGSFTGSLTQNRMALLELEGIARHSFDQIAAGGSIFQVFTQHAASMVQALSYGPGGITGAFKAVASWFTPIRIGMLAIAAATVTAEVGLHSYNVQLERLNQLSAGVGGRAGLTGKQLDVLSGQGASASGSTVKEARELGTALVQTGQISGKAFADLYAAQTKYAVATGRDLKVTRAALVQMFLDPKKGAEELQRQFGKLTDSQKQQIDTLVDQNRADEAQVLLAKRLREEVEGLGGQLAGLAGIWARLQSASSQASHSMIASVHDTGVAALQAVGLAKAAAKASNPAADNDTSTFGANIARGLNTDDKRLKELNDQATALALGRDAALRQKDGDAAKIQSEALDKVTHAQTTYMREADRAAAATANQIKASRAHSVSAQAEVAAEQERIALAGQNISAAEAEQRIAGAAAVARAQASEALRMEAAAIEADTRAALGLAAAYLVSAEAGMRAEAARKAAVRATRGDISYAQAYRRQLAQDVADTVANGAKAAEAAQAVADAETHAADAMQERGKSSGAALQAMREEQALRPLVTAQAVAQAEADKAGTRITQGQRDALNEATAALEAHRKALSDDAAEQLRIQNLTDAQSNRDQIEVLQLEAKLIGASNVERARAIALLRAEQAERAKGFDPLTPTDKQRRAHDAAVKSSGDVAVADAGLQSGQFIKSATDALAQQRTAYLLDAAAIGMTNKQAAAFRFEQERLAEAARLGITLDKEQRDGLHALAGRYGEVSEAAIKLAHDQKAAADAAELLGDSMTDALTTILDDGHKGNEALRTLAKTLRDDLLKSALTGRGAFAGLLGTDKTDGPGQANHGLLSQLFGKVFGQGKGGAPNGTPANPLWVRMAGGATESGGGVLGKLLGGSNDNDPFAGGPYAGATPLGPGFAQAAGGNSLDKMVADEGGFLAGLNDVFKENTSGGFVGGLKGVFKDLLGGIGGGGGLTGGLGGMLEKLLGGGGVGSFISNNQGGIGSILGTVLATVAHDGLHPGATSTGRSRAVDPAIFLHAPRLHMGLAPDEFPAILQRGEGVDSKRDVASGRRGHGPVTVNVYGVEDMAGFRRNDRQIARSMRQRYGLS